MLFNCDGSVTLLVNSNFTASHCPSKKKKREKQCHLLPVSTATFIYYCITLLFLVQVTLVQSSAKEEPSDREPRQCKLPVSRCNFTLNEFTFNDNLQGWHPIDTRWGRPIRCDRVLIFAELQKEGLASAVTFADACGSCSTWKKCASRFACEIWSFLVSVVPQLTFQCPTLVLVQCHRQQCHIRFRLTQHHQLLLLAFRLLMSTHQHR